MSEENSSFDFEVDLEATEGKYLTFLIENQLFGIPISTVLRIISVQEISSIPEFPDYAKGVINLRGEIIPVIDMRLRLQRKPVPYTDKTCIIIVHINQQIIGFIVDSIEDVAEFQPEDISLPPEISHEKREVYLMGLGRIGKNVALLIAPEKLLSKDEQAMVSSMVKTV